MAIECQANNIFTRIKVSVHTAIGQGRVYLLSYIKTEKTFLTLQVSQRLESAHLFPGGTAELYNLGAAPPHSQETSSSPAPPGQTHPPPPPPAPAEESCLHNHLTHRTP